MNWKQWPFYPKTLTDMIGPPADVADREGFVSLLVSGCSERLGRPLTVVEPELDAAGRVRQEADPDNPGQTRLKLRRIDQINPREHFAGLCTHLRELPGQEQACRLCDADIARQVIQTAIDDPQALGRFPRGYECHMSLLDQAAVIRHYRTPVAVIFSGQFLADEPEARQRLKARLDRLAGERRLTPELRQMLHRLADRLETREQFIERYIAEKAAGSPAAAAALQADPPTVDQLFLEQVREIERIACAQFQMHKRDRESEFRHHLRHQFPFLPLAGRQVIAERIQPVLEEVRRFCGSDYLALFISPQRYISFEENPNLLPPFAFTGVEDSVRAGLLHFNWRKAGLPAGQEHPEENEGRVAAPSVRFLTAQARVQQAVKSGLKGETATFFDKATILGQIGYADAYRAILIWGPFPHLTAADLQRETHFLEEVSELVMMRLLSSVQRSDSERRTAAWSDVAGLLGHYSRRAMTPVSTGVRIISDYLKGGGTYSKEDALNATDSLEAASNFIAQAVRAPLASFAAMAEEVYEFAPASLNRIVQEAVALYRPLALEKSVTIKVDAGLAGLPLVEVDAAKLRDAVGYVLDNAIKYSHPDKEVRIYGKDLGRQVRLTIEDFGQGIRDEERHLVFGRGYQGHRSRKAIYEPGEGMGLFHARLIVEAHKGKIWCGCRSGLRSDSSAVLEGYRVWFTFELPVQQAT